MGLVVHHIMHAFIFLKILFQFLLLIGIQHILHLFEGIISGSRHIDPDRSVLTNTLNKLTIY